MTYIRASNFLSGIRTVSGNIPSSLSLHLNRSHGHPRVPVKLTAGWISRKDSDRSFITYKPKKAGDGLRSGVEYGPVPACHGEIRISGRSVTALARARGKVPDSSVVDVR